MKWGSSRQAYTQRPRTMASRALSHSSTLAADTGSHPSNSRAAPSSPRPSSLPHPRHLSPPRQSALRSL